MGRVLIMTVGTGDVRDVENTLFAPLRKSIRKERWKEVILLPSQLTRANAEAVQASIGDLPVRCRPLPERGMEDDPDRCFEYFDDVLADVISSGTEANDVVADITRGTKAMSAALVLAAVGRGVKTLRYIYGERDERGMVKPGTEQIADVRTSLATARRDVERARRFLESYSFAAAAEVCPDAWGKWLARFWGAWDRFDYRRAQELTAQRPKEKCEKEWGRFRPSMEQKALLQRLGQRNPGDRLKKADWLRCRVADMLANARRRAATGHFEDALLRSYRAQEMIGQARLFLHMLDSEDLDDSRPEVQKWLKQREDAKNPVLRRQGRLEIGKGLVADLLVSLGDEMGTALQEEGRFKGLTPKMRNKSLLIHGFEAKTQGLGKEKLLETVAALEQIFRMEEAGNDHRLQAAQFGFGGG
jgi:CRISPR-associated protein (TIGR02710 family)